MATRENELKRPRNVLRRARQTARETGQEGVLSGGKQAGAEAPLSDQEKKELKKWLDRQADKTRTGGLLSGPSGGAALVQRLRYDPALAQRVRQWMDENPVPKGVPYPKAFAGGEGLQAKLLQEFPELYEQYVAATGMSIVYGPEGQPVRLVDPSKPFGMRTGDELRTPTLYNAKGEVVERPKIKPEEPEAIPDTGAFRFGAIPLGDMGDDELDQLGGAVRSMLEARRARQAAQQNYGETFSYEDLFGGPEE